MWLTSEGITSESNGQCLWLYAIHTTQACKLNKVESSIGNLSITSTWNMKNLNHKISQIVGNHELCLVVAHKTPHALQTTPANFKLHQAGQAANQCLTERHFDGGTTLALPPKDMKRPKPCWFCQLAYLLIKQHGEVEGNPLYSFLHAILGVGMVFQCISISMPH